jgi:hypothetical protein
VYRPDPAGAPGLAVHISANTRPLPSRRGHSNAPHVFVLEGAVPRALAALLGPPPPLPPRRSPVPASAAGKADPLRPARTARPDALQTWNDPGVFARFLDALNRRTRLALREAAGDARGSPSPGADVDADYSSDLDGGALDVPFASSPARPVRRRHSLHASAAESDSEDERRAPPRARSLSAGALFERVPLVTPAPPPGSRLARRVSQASARIARISAMLDSFPDSDEEDEEAPEPEPEPAPALSKGKARAKTAVKEELDHRSLDADEMDERGRSPRKKRLQRAASEEL